MALYVVNCLSHTTNLGIYFSSLNPNTLESFLHFAIPSTILSMSDANWGPQDASMSTSIQELPLFASQSMSAFYIDLFGPLRWMSKRHQLQLGVLWKLKYMLQMSV